MGLRVLHITEDFSSHNAGIANMIQQLSGWMHDCCDWVGVYSTGNTDIVVAEGVHIFADDQFRFPYSWRYPAGCARRLRKIIKEHDVQIVHLHGIWRAAPWVGQRVANQLGVATILTVHGQCEPWAMRGQGYLKLLKKKLYWFVMAHSVFRHVSMLHAITHLEATSLNCFLPGRRAQVIPNAVDMDVVSGISVNSQPEHEILFLGRIHPVKSVDRLIQAFYEADLDRDWRLLVAGPDEVSEYSTRLHKMVSKMGYEDRVKFLGPIYGKEKIRQFQRAWVVVVPSFSEVVGMVNLEASACQTPTITTHATGLSNWQEGGGLLIDSEVDDLRSALESVCRWSKEMRMVRGQRSRTLVENYYSLDVVGRQWLKNYQELVDGNGA